MDDPDVAELDDPVRWAPAAARLLATLGFSLINSDRPAAPGGSNLLVALRDRPTLRHYDPEVISFWVAREGRGTVATLDRDDPVGDRAVSWGSVRIADRLAVENRFLAFGGLLRSAAVEPGLTVVTLRSPGPIVRWGGHSQAWDPLAGEIGAFFGRLMIPVDFEPGAEPRLAAADPAVLYAAFVRDARRRVAPPAPGSGDDPLVGWLAAEAHRLERDLADAWAGGGTLLAELRLR